MTSHSADLRRTWSERIRPRLALRSICVAILAIVVWLCADEGKAAIKSIAVTIWEGTDKPFPSTISALASGFFHLTWAGTLLAVASYVILVITPRLVRPQIEAKRGADLAPRPVVILIISDPRRSDEKLTEILSYYRGLPIEDVIFDTSPNSEQFAWQHSLRALWRHVARDRTTRVFVIHSKETVEYLPRFRDFINMLASGTGANLDLVVDPGGPIDFNDFSACERAIGDLVNNLAVKRGALHRPRDISLDVTGGTKLSGIAAAVISMNRDLEFSYVPNNFSRENQNVVVFDAQFETINIRTLEL